MMNLLKSLFTSASSTVSVTSLKERLGQNSLLILDVRQPEEFLQGHIEGACLIPLGELRQRMDELPADREIVCVCRSGSRSSIATRQLRNAGYNAVNLQGGMMAWHGSRLPIKKGK